jgi:WD40 repeat protein
MSSEVGVRRPRTIVLIVFLVVATVMAVFLGLSHPRVGKPQTSTSTGSGSSVVLPFRASAVAINPSGTLVAVVSILDGLRVLGVSGSSSNVLVKQAPPDIPITPSMAFSPNGNRLAVAGLQGGYVWVLNPLTGGDSQQLKGDGYPVLRVAFAPDGSRIVGLGSTGKLIIWDASGNRIDSPALNSPGGMSLTVGRDGLVAVGGSDGTVHIWDTRDGTLAKLLDTGAKQVYSLSFSPDSKLLATSGGLSARVDVWDASTGRLVKRVSSAGNFAGPLCFIGESGHLAITDEGGIARIVDPRSGSVLTERDGLYAPITDVSCGSRTVSIGSEREVQLLIEG